MRSLVSSIILILIISSFISRGQNTEKLLLINGTLDLKSSSEGVFAEPDSDEFKFTKFIRLVQFESLPDSDIRVLMEKEGIEFWQYIPNKAFYLNIPISYDVSRLDDFGAYFAVLPPDESRLSKEVYNYNWPDHCIISPTEVKVNVMCVPITGEETLLQELNKAGARSIKKKHTNVFELVYNPSNIRDLLKLSFIEFIESCDPPPIPENYTGTQSHRSTFVKNIKNGLNYDGSGITLGHGDDGSIGDHIDWKGRLTDQAGASGGTHGEHVAGIAMGAGNLDPRAEGNASGAHNLYDNYPDNLNDFSSEYSSDNVRVTVSSYGESCNGGYTSSAYVLDLWSNTYPKGIHVFSAGNSGASDCNYGAGVGWGNITGGHKMGKNVIATGNLDFSDNLSSSSSRGPASDGRIKPDICAVGTQVYSTISGNTYGIKSGTSMACPGASGVLAQMMQAYKETHGNTEPEAALMKSILMNTADDLGNPGPDFKYGYGRINAKNAIECIINDHFIAGSYVDANGANTHVLNVPTGLKEVKIMLYWMDVQASTGAAVALINDLDLTVSTTGSTGILLPWVLNSAPNAVTLDDDAVRGPDHLNNVEQVTLKYPNSGNYTITVDGNNVPSLSQDYFIVYQFIDNNIDLTYPIGGENLVLGEIEYIKWDNPNPSVPVKVEYSSDGGSVWNEVGTVAANQFAWTIPNDVTSQGRIRLNQNGYISTSDKDFVICSVPQNLSIDYACSSTLWLSWDAVPNANGYTIYKLGNKYMEKVDSTTSTDFAITGLNLSNDQWVAVSARYGNKSGRRSIAIKYSGGSASSCLATDLAITNMKLAETFSLCNSFSSVDVRLSNLGINPIVNPSVIMTIGSQSINHTWTGSLSVGEDIWVSVPFIFSQTSGSCSATASHSYSGDLNSANNSISKSINVLSSNTISSFPYLQDFDSFTLCSSANNCGGTICNLGSGWLNPQNSVVDDVDWRTYSGTPPTGAGYPTGPSSDHTSGSGKYLYLETSQTVPCTFKEALLFSPCFDLTSISNPVLEFYSHLYGTSMGTLQLDLIVDGEYIESVIPAFTRNQNIWQKHVLDLTSYSGSNVTLVFKGVTGSSFLSDMAIDDVSITQLPAPVAAFTDNSPTELKDVLQLKDISDYFPTLWTWSITPSTFVYADGTSSNSQNPRVIFSSPDTYTINLTASNIYGSSSTNKVFSIGSSTYAEKKWDNGGGTNQWGDGRNWNPDGMPSPVEEANLEHTHVVGVYTVEVGLETSVHAVSVATNVTLVIQSVGKIHIQN